MIFFAGQYTRLFPEPDLGVEVSLSNSSGQTYRTFLQSTLPGQYTEYSVFIYYSVGRTLSQGYNNKLRLKSYTWKRWITQKWEIRKITMCSLK